MRGTVEQLLENMAPTRITPAHAGNSRTTFYSYNRYQDHPRTCGEQRVLLSSPFPKFGSPPHMRGTDFLKPDHVGKERITPAHAGNSKREGSVIWDTQDHPRTCGEQLFTCSSLYGHLGSPPHMRGTGAFASFIHNTNRITPAHAGNRSKGLCFSCGH